MFESDTIAAISTPIGEGGIGIIRISGPKAEAIAREILYQPHGLPWSSWEERRVYYGVIKNDHGERLDEAIFFLFKAPRSYTKEDVVEIQIHGNPRILHAILELVLKHGARIAEPGEFTRRAFENGRIDLAQAEGIIDLIRARTLRSGKAAAELMSGELSERVQVIRDELMSITAEMEAALDYPEDDIEVTAREALKRRIEEVSNKIQKILNQGMAGLYLREGITVVMAGRPNVGKSSLLNTLLRKDRAIVTDIPGTTRDIIEDELEIQGIPLRLIDTAGLRESDNPVEQIGIKRAEDWLNRADLILFLVDGGEALTEEDYEIIKKLEGRKFLNVINKTDQPLKLYQENLQELTHDHSVIAVSAKTKEGIEELEAAILKEIGVESHEPDREVLLTHLRHKNALEICSQRIDEVIRTMDMTTDDLLVIGMRSALQELGKITGEDIDEEIINEIFNNFCLGK